MSLPTVTDMDQPRCVCLEVRISHLHGIFKKYFAGKIGKKNLFFISFFYVYSDCTLEGCMFFPGMRKMVV